MIDEIGEQLTSVYTDNRKGQIDDYGYDDQGQQCDSSIERISNIDEIYCHYSKLLLRKDTKHIDAFSWLNWR